jgi:hypothetical protein
MTESTSNPTLHVVTEFIIKRSTCNRDCCSYCETDVHDVAYVWNVTYLGVHFREIHTRTKCCVQVKLFVIWYCVRYHITIVQERYTCTSSFFVDHIPDPGSDLMHENVHKYKTVVLDMRCMYHAKSARLTYCYLCFFCVCYMYVSCLVRKGITTCAPVGYYINLVGREVIKV